MEKRKNYLLKVKKSRKSYLFAYLMALIVAGAIIYLNYNGYEINQFVLALSLLFIFGIIITIEILHIREWWGIDDSSLTHSVSILNKNVRDIGFSSISDLDLDQPFFKRILGYGNVNVRLFLNETSVNIKNINKPRRFIRDLQRVMNMKGGKQIGIRKV